MITIGIATYNRQDQLLKTIHTLLPFLKDTYELGTELIIYNDGGAHDLIDKVLQNVVDNHKVKIVWINGDVNKGVFQSKIQPMLRATNDFYTHLDDDDSIDLFVLSQLVKEIRNHKSGLGIIHNNDNLYPAIQFNVSRLYYNWKKDTPRWFNRFDWIRKSYYSDNARTLVGMLFYLPKIRHNLDSYLQSEISSFKSTVNGYGDDVFIAGYLTQDIPNDKIGYCDLCLQYQTYNDKDYHISTDKSIPQRAKKEDKIYVLHNKLKKPKFKIELTYE